MRTRRLRASFPIGCMMKNQMGKRMKRVPNLFVLPPIYPLALLTAAYRHDFIVWSRKCSRNKIGRYSGPFKGSMLG